MPLSIQSFKHVAAGYQTHKERAGENPVTADLVLSEPDLDRLRQQYSDLLDDELFQQVVLVRKRHREHVPHMLQSLVDFRNQQGWKYRIESSDLNPLVKERRAHTVEAPSNEESNHLPMLRIAYGNVDPTVASAKDFQHEFQYTIQEASRLHDQAEIAVTCDFQGTSFGVLARMNKDDLLRGMAIFHTFPVKVKRIYIVNAVLPVRLVMKAVLALASRRVREKVKFVDKKNQDTQS